MIALKIGARTLKTALAIYLSLVIPSLLGIPETADLAIFAAIFSMHPSVRETYNYIVNRVFANALGGLIAIFFTMYFDNNYLMIALAALILIAILHALKLNDMIGLAVSALVIIMLNAQDANNQVAAALTRVLATIIGVIIAFLVNLLVFPPRYDIKFYNLTLKITDGLTKYVRAILRKNSQYMIMRSDIEEIHEQLTKLNMYYLYVRDPLFTKLSSKKYYELLRKVAVSRQSLKASQALYDLTSLLIESEDTINHMPFERRTLIRERLETLMTAHEQILLKWSGKILPDEVNFMDYKADLRKSFMEALYSEATSDTALKQVDFIKSNTLISIMAKIFEYEEQLLHLNTLMSSYMKRSGKNGSFEAHFEE
ncbi:FUSC family protein [Allofustis seminis]|uniref:FUSC family protein n=1 Tax=Allofustis seminis TaxID=166939 RepID=UPI00036A9A71|nr:aromatic acid exporter family protein [Allofustis seminis]